MKKHAEVMLTQPVDNLGEPGDVVHVAAGHARNYLLPQGLAVAPTKHNQERFRKIRDAQMIELRNREEQAKVLQKQLVDYQLTFYRKVHEEGKLYSSVRLEEIAAMLSEALGTEIEKSKVQLRLPIETIGRHAVTIGLYKDIIAEVQVEVRSEEEAPESAAEREKTAS